MDRCQFGERYCPTDRVGIFYSFHPGSKRFNHVTMGIFSAIPAWIFAGIHLFAWTSPFPTSIEGFLWRGASIALAIMPLLGLALAICRHLNSRYAWMFVVEERLQDVFWATIYLCILARIYLLVEGLIGLRRPPPTVHETVDWISVLPHI